MKYLISILLCFFSVQGLVVAQEKCLGSPNKVIDIPYGDSSGKLFFYSTDEYFRPPYGPIVTTQGDIYFYSKNQNEITKIDKGKILTFERTGSEIPSAGFPIYKNEIIYLVWDGGVNSVLFTKGYLDFKNSWDRYYAKITGVFDAGWTIVENRLVGEYTNPEVLTDRHFFSLADEQNVFYYYDEEQTREWIKQNGKEYSIASDNLLYKNGMLHTANRSGMNFYCKNSNSGIEWRLGVDVIGNMYWKLGGYENTQRIAVIAPSGIIEMYIDLPPLADNPKGVNRYNVVSMTEDAFIYYLEAPTVANMDGKSYAPLFKVRNHLEHFGRLNDDQVRMRKGPSTKDDIIVTLPKGTGFHILETGNIQETISGKTAPWYRVRLTKDGMEGWVFGGFIEKLSEIGVVTINPDKVK